MIILICALVAAVTFLFVLNGFLQGTGNAEIKAFLRLMQVGLIVAALFVAGWFFALVAVAVAGACALVGRPLAARLASRILSFPSGRKAEYIGLPSRRIQKLSQILAAPFPPTWAYSPTWIFRFGLLSRGLEYILAWLAWVHMNTRSDSMTNAEQALLDYCEREPSLSCVLREFNGSRKELADIYHGLIMEGAGQWRCGHFVPVSTLAYPEALRYALSRRERKGKDEAETAYNLMMYFERGTPLDRS